MMSYLLVLTVAVIITLSGAPVHAQAVELQPSGNSCAASGNSCQQQLQSQTAPVISAPSTSGMLLQSPATTSQLPKGEIDVTGPALSATTAGPAVWSQGTMWAGLFCLGLAVLLGVVFCLLLWGNSRTVHYVKMILPPFLTKTKKDIV